LKNAFFIVGPTASGKSDLAADVALRCGAEVVSADAFQIYRGLPILTAQPDGTTLTKVPHHLVGTVPLAEEMSAEKFRALAMGAIEDINRRGKLALVVGGSGLYLKALTHGLAPLPAVDAKLRAKLNALSLDELNGRLAKVDSLGAEKIDRQNKRRVVRALEIFAQTNTPASAQRREWASGSSDACGVFVFRERAELYARIERRVEEMFRDEVTEEVARIGELSKTAEKTLGLDQVRQLLDGKISPPDCIAEIERATRRYAKRQLTWFRRQPNFAALNLSLLKDHAAAVDWVLQKVLSFARP
jgi:tRNA dimethylallyltransferase